MTKHHEKEEEIFLPMAGHALLAQQDEIKRRLKEFDTETSGRDWDL
jgi:hemerythrin-like domain-containing protein